MAEIQVQTISFDPGGIAIAYIEVPTDVRVKGAVVMQRQLSLSAEHPDYSEDISTLHHRAVKVLRNALEDFHDSEPYTPGDEHDDDDERGMGE